MFFLWKKDADTFNNLLDNLDSVNEPTVLRFGSSSQNFQCNYLGKNLKQNKKKKKIINKNVE